LALGDQVLGDLGLPLQPRQPGSWYMRANCSPGGQAPADRQQVTTNLQACAGSGSTWNRGATRRRSGGLDEQLVIVGEAR
jgi:hypothetical protein